MKSESEMSADELAAYVSELQSGEMFGAAVIEGKRK